MPIIELTDEEFNDYQRFIQLDKKSKKKNSEINRTELSEKQATEYWSNAAKDDFKRIYLNASNADTVDILDLKSIWACFFTSKEYRNSVKYYFYKKNSIIDYRKKILFVLSGSMGLIDNDGKTRSFGKEGYLLGTMKLSHYYHFQDDLYNSSLTMKAYDDVIIAEWDASTENLKYLSSDPLFITSVVNDLTDIIKSNNAMTKLLCSPANKRVCLAAYALVSLKEHTNFTSENYWVPKAVRVQQTFNWTYLSEVSRILKNFCEQGILEEVTNPDTKSKNNAYIIRNKDELKRISGLDDNSIQILSRVIRT